MTAAAWKTSAGAAARLPVARATNLNRTLRAYERRRVRPGRAWTARPTSTSPTSTEVAGTAGAGVGSEGNGLSRLVRETCDVVAAIPIGATVESLNAGVAAGIALYEISRRALTRTASTARAGMPAGRSVPGLHPVPSPQENRDAHLRRPRPAVDYTRHRVGGLPGRARRDRDGRAPDRRRHPRRAGRPALLAQADRLGELRLARPCC